MKSYFAIILGFFVLTSCRTGTPISYNANPLNVRDPISVIRDTIKKQPTAYAYMPTYLEVDDQCIQLYMGGSRPTAMPIVGGGKASVAIGPGASNISPEFVCYQNVGRIALSHIKSDNVWRVKIDDKRGNYMYWVYTFERSEAERFIDAIYTFVNVQK